jgi:hypothetical protein
MAIRRSDKVRLARLAGPRLWEERRVVEERVKLRDRARFRTAVGVLLCLEGIDPETTCIARAIEEAEAALDAIPDSEELERTDEAYLARTSWFDEWQPKSRYRPPRVEEPIERDIERRMKRYRTDGKNPDLAKLSVFDLYCWCLSHYGESYDEAAGASGKAAEEAAKDLLLFLDTLPDNPSDEDIERAISARKNQ